MRPTQWLLCAVALGSVAATWAPPRAAADPGNFLSQLAMNQFVSGDISFDDIFNYQEFLLKVFREQGDPEDAAFTPHILSPERLPGEKFEDFVVRRIRDVSNNDTATFNVMGQKINVLKLIEKHLPVNSARDVDERQLARERRTGRRRAAHVVKPEPVEEEVDDAGDDEEVAQDDFGQEDVGDEGYDNDAADDDGEESGGYSMSKPSYRDENADDYYPAASGRQSMRSSASSYRGNAPSARQYSSGGISGADMSREEPDYDYSTDSLAGSRSSYGRAAAPPSAARRSSENTYSSMYGRSGQKSRGTASDEYDAASMDEQDMDQSGRADTYNSRIPTGNRLGATRGSLLMKRWWPFNKNANGDDDDGYSKQDTSSSYGGSRYGDYASSLKSKLGYGDSSRSSGDGYGYGRSSSGASRPKRRTSSSRSKNSPAAPQKASGGFFGNIGQSIAEYAFQSVFPAVHANTVYAARIAPEALDAERVPRWDDSVDVQAVFEDARDHRYLFNTAPDARGARVRGRRAFRSVLPRKFERRIPWLYANDGSYARADALIDLLQQARLPAPSKIYAFGELRLATQFAADQTNTDVYLAYHVAAVVRHRGQLLVLDPTVEPQRPLTVDQWLDRLASNRERQLDGVAICTRHTYFWFADRCDMQAHASAAGAAANSGHDASSGDRSRRAESPVAQDGSPRQLGSAKVRTGSRRAHGSPSPQKAAPEAPSSRRLLRRSTAASPRASTGAVVRLADSWGRSDIQSRLLAREEGVLQRVCMSDGHALDVRQVLGDYPPWLYPLQGGKVVHEGLQKRECPRKTRPTPSVPLRAPRRRPKTVFKPSVRNKAQRARIRLPRLTLGSNSTAAPSAAAPPAAKPPRTPALPKPADPVQPLVANATSDEVNQAIRLLRAIRAGAAGENVQVADALRLLDPDSMAKAVPVVPPQATLNISSGLEAAVAPGGLESSVNVTGKASADPAKEAIAEPADATKPSKAAPVKEAVVERAAAQAAKSSKDVPVNESGKGDTVNPTLTKPLKVAPANEAVAEPTVVTPVNLTMTKPQPAKPPKVVQATGKGDTATASPVDETVPEPADEDKSPTTNDANENLADEDSAKAPAAAVASPSKGLPASDSSANAAVRDSTPNVAVGANGIKASNGTATVEAADEEAGEADPDDEAEADPDDEAEADLDDEAEADPEATGSETTSASSSEPDGASKSGAAGDVVKGDKAEKSPVAAEAQGSQRDVRRKRHAPRV